MRKVQQELTDAKATDVMGAGRYESSDTRINERDGARPRNLATQLGYIDLRIPKLRQGLFFR